MSDKFIIDANVAISSLINMGASFIAILLNAILEKFKLIAPEFFFEEINKHKSKALKLTKLSEKEFNDFFEILFEIITPVPAKEFSQFLKEAELIAPHPKDEPYIALSLATKSPLLSGDDGLKSSKVKVFSPREFITLLLQ